MPSASCPDPVKATLGNRDFVGTIRDLEIAMDLGGWTQMRFLIEIKEEEGI